MFNSLRTKGVLFALFVFAFSLIGTIVQTSACAEALLPGYDTHAQSYTYVTFGTYPYEADGTEAPVLWRVLGWGVPDATDVITKENRPAKHETVRDNADTLTQENASIVCLMTEFIIDTVRYHSERDDNIDGPGLDYADSDICAVLNTQILPHMLTEAEQSTLIDMPERGRLSLPSRKGELFRRDYGFVPADFTVQPNRSATGTPYAFAKGLRRINKRSWYWTTDWRAPGRRWIVGDNGHISVSGLDREGGIRPICYVDTSLMTIVSGSGTLADPYVLSVKTNP